MSIDSKTLQNCLKQELQDKISKIVPDRLWIEVSETQKRDIISKVVAAMHERLANETLVKVHPQRDLTP